MFGAVFVDVHRLRFGIDQTGRRDRIGWDGMDVSESERRSPPPSASSTRSEGPFARPSKRASLC